MSKKKDKLWLTPVEGNVTKINCKICLKTFLLSNMREIAVKSHASGKKHQTAVTQSQKAGSVSHFFGARSETTPGSAVQDDLIVEKFQFFASTVSVMMPYLQKFQGDAPLLPFIATKVTVLLETLMQKFIKQSEMQAANSPVKIAKLNVMETGIHVAPSDVDVGFAATATLTKAYKEKKLSQQQVFELKKECCAVLSAIVTKIQKRSPLKCSFARKLIRLDPRLIAAEPGRAVAMFREVLTKLVDKKWRTSEQAEHIWMQYKKLVSEVKQFQNNKFAGFTFGED